VDEEEDIEVDQKPRRIGPNPRAKERLSGTCAVFSSKIFFIVENFYFVDYGSINAL